MQYRKTYEQVKASITKEELLRFKTLVKSKGMTLQGSLGELIKAELKKAEEEDGTRNA